MIAFILNNSEVQLNKPGGYLLVDAIRYHFKLKGTKLGCREGDCGACTVLIGQHENGEVHYKQATSCLTPIANIAGKHVVTIEGLAMQELSPVQQALVEESGTQCGFCTPGFVMSLSNYSLSETHPSAAKAKTAIDGNICRCTGYKSIERAASHITKLLENKDANNSMEWLIEHKFIPAWFSSIPKRLKQLPQHQHTLTNAIVVGGGTDLYVQQPDKLEETPVNPLSQLSELNYIKADNNVCRLGAAVTVSNLLESETFNQLFPTLWPHLKLVSSTPIRNMATLAGNLVNASPIGDLTAFLMALDAHIVLSDSAKTKTIPLKQFYKGYKQLDKLDRELITEIFFTLPDKDTHFNFEKISKRIHLDIASVNTAISIRVADNIITQVHLSAGGIGPTPAYLSNTVKYLTGKVLAPATIKAANNVLQNEISPISDVRGQETYKRLLVRQLFYAHFITLFPKTFTLPQLI